MRRAARNTVTMRSMFCEEVHTKIARVAQAAAVGLHEQRVRVERAVVHQQRRDPERSDLERALIAVEARILEPVSVGHVPGRRLEDAVQGEGVDSGSASVPWGAIASASARALPSSGPSISGVAQEGGVSSPRDSALIGSHWCIAMMSVTSPMSFACWFQIASRRGVVRRIYSTPMMRPPLQGKSSTSRTLFDRAAERLSPSASIRYSIPRMLPDVRFLMALRRTTSRKALINKIKNAYP